MATIRHEDVDPKKMYHVKWPDGHKGVLLWGTRIRTLPVGSDAVITELSPSPSAEGTGDVRRAHAWLQTGVSENDWRVVREALAMLDNALNA